MVSNNRVRWGRGLANPVVRRTKRKKRKRRRTSTNSYNSSKGGNPIIRKALDNRATLIGLIINNNKHSTLAQVSRCLKIFSSISAEINSRLISLNSNKILTWTLTCPGFLGHQVFQIWETYSQIYLVWWVASQELNSSLRTTRIFRWISTEILLIQIATFPITTITNSIITSKMKAKKICSHSNSNILKRKMKMSLSCPLRKSELSLTPTPHSSTRNLPVGGVFKIPLTAQYVLTY